AVCPFAVWHGSVRVPIVLGAAGPDCAETFHPSPLHFGADQFRRAKQFEDLTPNQIIQVIQPNHPAGTSRAAQPLPVVRAPAPIVLSALRTFLARTTIEAVTALFAHQEPLEQTRLFGIAQRKLLVLRQALLR